MFKLKESVFVGAGRYVQCSDALQYAGVEAALVGKKAYILGGQKSISIISDKLEHSLKNSKISYTIKEFKGHCTLSQAENFQRDAAGFDADVVIGIGGGKCIDTAKAVANLMKCGVLTIPTSAATCAAYSSMSVMYDDSGSVKDNMYHTRGVQSVIVDTDVINRECPARMMASGIGDALAKYPEISFTDSYFGDENKSAMTKAALELSGFITDVLTSKGQKACLDVQNRVTTPETDDITCANLALTGQASALVNGTKQLAIAHSFYNSVCALFKDQQKVFLHGELVSEGILLQMYVNGWDVTEIERMRGFLKSIGIPVCLKDSGIESSQKNIDAIYQFICSDVGIADDKIRYGIRKGMELLQ